MKVPKMWRNGDITRVKTYLKQDLDLTSELFQYGAQTGYLIYPHKEYGEFKGIRKVLINWRKDTLIINIKQPKIGMPLMNRKSNTNKEKRYLAGPYSEKDEAKKWVQNGIQ